MLSELERKLTSLVADLLTTRNDVQVASAADSSRAPASGKGLVRVGLSELGPCAVFEHGQFAAAGSGDAPARRRIQPLRFTARLVFVRNPQGITPAALVAARGRLLDDVSLVAHGLGAAGLRNGNAFVTDVPDPGFRVVGFDLKGGAAITLGGEAGAPGDPLSAELSYQGQVEIWPPGVTEDEGVLRAVDVLVEAQPVQISVTPRGLRAGETATVRLAVPGRRLLDALGGRGPLSLLLVVRSDAPPAERGVVTSGDPGPETGTRLVAAMEPETLVEYSAPTAAAERLRVEHLLVYLARPDGGRSTFLGSAAVQILPGSP